LPKLHDDLSAGILDTLSAYKVKYSFEVKEPSSDIEKHIVNLCAKKAAADLATQRGREYGFGLDEDASMRATAIHELDASVLEYLPTDNLYCEKDLTVFDKLAQRSAACSNKKFTAKGICDEVTLNKCSPVNVEKCKSWGGPLTDIQEFEDIMQYVNEDGKLKSILRNEIAYRKHTSHDAKTRPQLYKLNQISILYPR